MHALGYIIVNSAIFSRLQHVVHTCGYGNGAYYYIISRKSLSRNGPDGCGGTISE